MKVRLLATVVILILSLSVLVFSQENKEDKCGKLSDCLQSFYKECLNDEVINQFVPKDVDKFGVVNYEDEMARLDNYYVELNNNPNAVGFIVVYGGRVNKFGEFKERVKRLQTYIKERKYDPNRIKVIQGGFREKFEFEFWVSPTKKSFPPLTPTIEAEKVKFKGVMKPLPTFD